MSSVLDAATSGIGGFVNGFLSGIIGGGTSTPTSQQIDLKINSQIAISGTSTIQSNLFDNVFALPGTLNNRNNLPFYPEYNLPMGIYYLSNAPKVTYKELSYNLDIPATSTGVRTKSTFTIDETSYQLVFNPSLSSFADIQNIRKEVLYLPSASAANKIDYEASGLQGENVAGKAIFSAVNYITLKASSSSTYYNGNRIVVRISFDVVPKNGSPRVKIVKTFKTTLQKN
ncbi:hypothetical protein SAMN03003324_01226 [Pedobacter antarcticus]|uniref:Uncharacterized protein n=1 Tax=Pedobacter antarcticus TaxID=34086 RepID=A0A1I2CW25_9SPHI|nr:hypothetical protein SAMN03003324_01226 [Pedobacter antarcticus]